jgi:hypothetical protein
MQMDRIRSVSTDRERVHITERSKVVLSQSEGNCERSTLLTLKRTSIALFRK